MRVHAPRESSFATASFPRRINEIQRTWSYLEPLFIHSDEVKRELPVDAERFAGIDVEIKDILTTSVTQREFPSISQLEVCENGVNVTFRHRDAVDEALRESTRRVREPRQFRECRSTQVLGHEKYKRGLQRRRHARAVGGGISWFGFM